MESKEFQGYVLDYRFQKDKNVVLITIQNQKELFLVRLSYDEEDFIKEKVIYGTYIKGSGVYKLPTESFIPNTFSYPTYLKGKGIFYYVEAENYQIVKRAPFFYSVKDRIRKSFDYRVNSVYLKMLFLGISEEGEEEVISSFRMNGILHLFVISGMHFSYLSRILEKIFSKFFKGKITRISTFLGISLYYFFLSKSVSSDRAFLFSMVSFFNYLFQLSFTKKQLFWYSLVFHLFLSPFSVYQIGFWYSYLLSFFFLFCSSFYDTKKYSCLKRSILAFLVSLPLTILQNYSFNPYSIFINVLMIWLMNAFLFPFFLFSVFFPPLDFVFVFFLSFIERFSLFLESLPFSKIPVSKISLIFIVFCYILLFFFFVYQKKIFVVVFFLLGLSFIIRPYFDSQAYIYFLDVGQGDATLFVSPYQKEILLLDTGKQNEYLANNILTFLRSLGISKIHYLILSHGDEDHAGNASYIMERFPVSFLVLNDGLKNALEQELDNKYSTKVQNQINTKLFSITNLEHQLFSNENDNSRILHVCIYHVCSLFLGDASEMVEKEIVRKYNFSAQILKVAHHGSRTSTSEELLNEITFSHAMISAGRNNRYSHPHFDVLERLRNHNIMVWSTKEFGTIWVKIRKKEYTIHSFLS